MVCARIAGSSASGMPALTSSMWAPAATWASASAVTRVKSPAAISAARILRPVGLMRSPMMTNGRSKPMTTSFVAELMTVSVIELPYLMVDPDRAPETTAPPRLAKNHDVHAADTQDGTALLDEFDADGTTFARLVLRAREPLDDGIGNVHARNVRAHPLGGLGGAQRPHPNQDERLADEAQVFHSPHEV